MANKPLLVAVVTGLVLAGCGSADREWLKPDQAYTAEEFRRDHAACSPGGKLDEACMKSRGWVSVNPPKPDKTPVPQQPTRPQGRY
jgi:hypothetical protein